MPQNIKFYQPSADGMVVKMGRERAGGGVVRGILNRCKVVDITVFRDNHNPSRMLPRRTFYPGAAGNQTIYFRISATYIPFGQVTLDKAVGCFFRHCGNSAGAKYIILTE